MKNKTIFIMLSMILYGIMGLSCEPNHKDDSVLAEVGNTTLTIDQLPSYNEGEQDTTLNRSEIENYVYRWINNEVLYQAAVDEGIIYSVAFQNELKRIKRDLTINYYLNQKLNKTPVISGEKISTYYESHRTEFVRDKDEYRYFFIICKDQKTAQNFLQEIRNGTSFSNLVEEHYPDNILNKKWDSGYVTRNEVVPVIQKIIVNMNEGNIYGPVASKSGPILFKLSEKFEAGTARNMDQVKDFIRKRLQEKEYREQYNQLLVSLRKKKNININLEINRKAVERDTNKTE